MIRLKNIIEVLPKSNLQAGLGSEEGKYPFYTSSMILSKRCDICLYKRNAIVMGTGGTASIHFGEAPFSTSTDCYVFSLKDNNYNLKYVFLKIYSQIDLIDDIMFQGMGLKHLNKSLLGEIRLPDYDIKYQETIANFLDEKIKKIDELIKLQEASIEKLDVFKEALIRKNVSNYIYHKGDIDSFVYNKESLRIDSVCKIIRGNSAFTKNDLSNDGDFVGLQYGKTYKVDAVDKNYNVYVKSNFYKESQVCKNGNTIIISTSETMEDLGHTCFYSREDLGLLGGEQMMLIPNQETISDKFLYYLSIVFTKKLRRHATGLKVFRFNTQHLKNIFFNLPSKEVQYKIVKILDEKIPKTNQLIQLKKDKIDKLNEYKKSLIYEAVTGKIEVM
jgi:type I restriction enzyme S subunit